MSCQSATLQAAVTIIAGRIAWKDGKIHDAKGTFIPLSPSSPYLFSVVQQRDKVRYIDKHFPSFYLIFSLML